MIRRLLILCAATAGLAACSSTPPLHYHTLLAPPPAQAAAVQPAPFVFEVLPVGIPAQLDQAQLVVRERDGTLAIRDGERWAGPLAEEVRTELSAELARRLGTQDVAGLARPAGKTLLRIKVQVRRLDAWPGSNVQLEADWSIGVADDKGNARLACHGRFDQPAGSGYPDVVRAQQQALGALAARIAVDARNWDGMRTAACAEAS